MKTIETGQKQETGQFLFEFCSGCGCYLLPEAGKAVIRRGVPAVLCPDCQSPAMDTGGMDDTDKMAAEFALKYNIPD